MKRPLILLFTFLFFTLLSLGLYVFHFKIKPEIIREVITKSPRPALGVSVEEAKVERWEERLYAIGTLRAFQGIDIAPQVNGVIHSILVPSGQDVPKGQLLVEIDDSVERADLNSGSAALQNATIALERQQQLIQGGSTSRAAYDQALAARDQAAAAVERFRSLIQQKKLEAPFEGRLGLRKVDVGQFVSPGTSIFTLQQLDPIFVDFPIPEQKLGHLSLGQKVDMEIDAVPNHPFQGQIQSIDARISPETRNVLVRAEVRNTDKSALPGMFANISLLVGGAKDRVTLPRTAITYSLYGDSVFIVKPQDAARPESPLVVERRFVRLGETRQERVSILEGVKPGELVVSSGQLKLDSGTPVKLIPNSTPEPLHPRPKE